MRTCCEWKCENRIKQACPNRDSSEDGFLFREVIKATLKTDLRKTRGPMHNVVTLMLTKMSRKNYFFIHGMAGIDK